MNTKTISRVIEQEIRFYGYEKRTKLFQVKTKLLNILFYTHETPLLLPAAVLALALDLLQC